VSVPLLVEFYLKLPQPQPGDDPDLWTAGLQGKMREFRDEVRAKYTEGTLQRLLASEDASCRRAAALAMGLIGTMRSNSATAAALKDDDHLVRKFAADSIWELWFRGGTDEQNWQLQQALRLPELIQALPALDDLVKAAPDFAEAFNQRAILHFRRGDYPRAVADCEAALRLNPFHFGAASGLGQCYQRMNKPRAALRAFKQALDIHPGLETVRDAVRELEAALGDGTREGE
jgi:tetratricopeptide (TPR) repeat protein